MSETTPNLHLPYIMAAQSQKHVTHNEAIRTLDALVQIAVIDRDLTAPPATPANGDRYIVPAAATGAWLGQSPRIAALQDGAWSFLVPREGWLAWVADENALLVFDGAAWVAASVGSVNPVAMIGVNTTADATNRLAVSAAASLFSHAGAGHQQKINKAAAADTASVLYQRAFSGRAEIGLTGNDDLTIKVSADGTAWKTALVIPGATGLPRVPSVAKAALTAAATAGIGALVHVSDETGGAVLAFSDGSSWRRVTDRAVVS